MRRKGNDFRKKERKKERKKKERKKERKKHLTRKT